MRIIEMRAMNMELTEAIRQYATDKVMSLEKFAARFDPCDVSVEIGKTSERHQKGEMFTVEILVSIPGDVLRSEVVKDDLYAAVDEAKDDMKRQFVEKKDRMISARTNDGDVRNGDALEE